MARRIPTLELAPLLAGISTADDGDEVHGLVLDTTMALLTTLGLRRWSIDDVADRAGIGRTTVYRRFESRDRLVHAVLARELRRFFLTIAEAVQGVGSVEDRVVEGVLIGIGLARGSVFVRLVESDPQTFLPFLTTNAGPLIGAARDVLVELAVREDDRVDRAAAGLVAEALVRLAVSFVVTPESAFAFDEPDGDAARRALHALVDPLLASASPPH